MHGQLAKGSELTSVLSTKQLTEYMHIYRSDRYTGIMETLMRFHSIASRRRKAAKRRMPRKKWQRPAPTFEEMIPEAMKEWFKINQFNSQQKFFKKFDPVGIPNDPTLIQLWENENEERSTLGNRIMLYESPVLQALAPVNMSHRYRGMPRSCNAIKAIDVAV